MHSKQTQGSTKTTIQMKELKGKQLFKKCKLWKMTRVPRQWLRTSNLNLKATLPFSHRRKLPAPTNKIKRKVSLLRVTRKRSYRSMLSTAIQTMIKPNLPERRAISQWGGEWITLVQIVKIPMTRMIEISLFLFKDNYPPWEMIAHLF